MAQRQARFAVFVWRPAREHTRLSRKEKRTVFFRYDEMPTDVLLAEQTERARVIADGLTSAEIRNIERRFVDLYLPNLDEQISGDVTRNGFTVYLGGFDWVTYQTPPQLLARFPEFMPLPQQTYTLPDEEAE